MSLQFIQRYAFLLGQNIKSSLQRTHCCIEVCAHKVCQIEFAVGLTYQQRSSFIKTGDMFSGVIIVGKYIAAILIAFQRLVKQHTEQFAHIHFHTIALGKFFKNAYPCIQVGRTVVAMHHCHRITTRCCYDIEFFIRFGQIMFQNCHAEDRCSRGYVTGTPCHAVCSSHARTCIAFRRTHRDTCLQSTARIKQFCAFFRQAPGIFACY